jgi:hypothetical protein
MATASTFAPARHEPQLLGQTVVVIGREEVRASCRSLR